MVSLIDQYLSSFLNRFFDIYGILVYFNMICDFDINNCYFDTSENKLSLSKSNVTISRFILFTQIYKKEKIDESCAL